MALIRYRDSKKLFGLSCNKGLRDMLLKCAFMLINEVPEVGH